MIKVRNREGSLKGRVKKSTWRKIQKRQKTNANEPVYGSYVYKFILYLDNDVNQEYCVYKRISGWQMYARAQGIYAHYAPYTHTLILRNTVFIIE